MINSLDLSHSPYSAARYVMMGKRGAVATSQHLASLAGVEMLLAGGNAVDAALAMAIALTVVEPTSNGIGSDAFALVWDGQLHGINGSGKSPKALNLNHFDPLGNIPEFGWLSVTVPGAVAAWYDIWHRWGTLAFAHLFEPAIRYAEEGFPVSPITAQAWQRAEKQYLPLQGREFQTFKQVFFPQNRAPKAGEMWGSDAHAYSLKGIAKHGGENFYRGETGEQIAHYANDTGGLLSFDDLAEHHSEWVNPIHSDYHGLSVWELPPNTQGIAALLALNILEGFDLAQYPRESVESYHLQIEAMKLAFADVYRHVGDPRYMSVTVEELLSKSYAESRRQVIQDHALPVADPGLPKGGTVYLCAADGELMISMIQSNFNGFGSGILVPDTGIALHNRGSAFTLTPGHPNQVAPQKRPFHTIIPGFLTQGDQPLGPFGVMGAQMQPQGHVQLVVNLRDYGMNPQTALNAPRWRFLRDNHVVIESGVSAEIASGLQKRGHQVAVTGFHHFGKGQMILRHNGSLVAGSEPRADGCAIAY
ncbi:gamma-glutamyltransferase family protein [Spirulina subsalsa FACHB-351]|uniref:Gamma-glutamyltransferase family protein n=1 Tax=Spirulina subsalsa FACHB-351 TaxID=234711 RepID=A0ABT3L5Z9_9CYAN|nr:gamma-glutamyltransferase family protein [Spirulina subsalsa]MCW6036923.1 gamma-glutamyltransferase family protein [Spirulina subsalsa FACHB-351]